MKTLRKNIDISIDTVTILQIEGTLSGFTTVKPFLEKIVNDFAVKSRKGRPEVYEKLLNQKIARVVRGKKTKLVKKAR